MLFSQPCELEASNMRKQSDLHALICPKVMLSDLLQLREAIKETHPDPYNHCTDSTFERAYQKAVLLTETPKTVIEFAQIINEFIGVLEDSHTSLNPRDLLMLCKKKRQLAPFYLTRIGGKFHLSKIQHAAIPLGVEVLSINEYAVDELYDLAESLAPSEGLSVQARNEIISLMMGLVFNVFNKTPDEPVEMRFTSLKGDTLSRNVPTLKVDQYISKNRWNKKKDLVTKLNDSTAYLGLSTFESRREQRFKRGIDSFFNKVDKKAIDHVVIDVRDNRGGYVLLLEYVLSYINKDAATFDLNYLYKRSPLDRFETLSRLKKIDFVKRAKRVYPMGMISKEYDFYKSNKGTTSSILYQKQLTNPGNKTYTGECTLFTNGLSMSASALMASWFKEQNRGEIIGTPCFGSSDGTHGNPARVVLKHSRIPISISTLKLSAVPKRESKEILPDIMLRYSIENIVNGIDPFQRFFQNL
tara:strand:+ start:32554 stop:33966 length:1413 start_codon:yes stop_codon:yes gene_type:complete